MNLLVKLFFLDFLSLLRFDHTDLKLFRNFLTIIWILRIFFLVKLWLFDGYRIFLIRQAANLHFWLWFDRNLRLAALASLLNVRTFLAVNCHGDFIVTRLCIGVLNLRWRCSLRRAVAEVVCIAGNASAVFGSCFGAKLESISGNFSLLQSVAS